MTSLIVSAPKLPEWKMNKSGTLKIPENVQQQIEYLHRKIGSTEWCGILFYSKEIGDLTDPETFMLRAEYIYPMDIGSPGYTSANISSENLIDMYETVPNAEKLKQGLIHTHHNMEAFFSGTDLSELHDNAPLHNYYLSLIVNFSGKWCAKVAYVAKVNKKFSFKNAEDVEASFTDETKVLMLMDMNIVKESEDKVSDEFKARFQKLKEENARPATTFYSTPYHSSKYGYESGAIDKSEQGELFQDRVFGKTPNGILRPKDEEDWEGGGHLGYHGYGAGGNGENDKEPWEKGQEASKKSVEKGGRQPLVTPDGKIATLNESQAAAMCIYWLTEGTKVNVSMSIKNGFKDVAGAIAFFETYFDLEHSSPNYEYFITCMQKELYRFTKRYSPIVVSHKFNQVLLPYVDNSRVAYDLGKLCNYHQQFTTEMERIERANRKNSVIVKASY